MNSLFSLPFQIAMVDEMQRSNLHYLAIHFDVRVGIVQSCWVDPSFAYCNCSPWEIM